MEEHTSSDVNTEGGAYIGGDANAGGDVIGRDRNETVINVPGNITTSGGDVNIGSTINKANVGKGAALLMIVGVLAVVLGSAAWLRSSLAPTPPPIPSSTPIPVPTATPFMHGDLKITIARFTVTDSDTIANPSLGLDMATNMATSIKKALDDLGGMGVISIWGPDQVSLSSCNDINTCEQAARTLATSIKADIVIYGTVDVSETRSTIRPLFYIHTDSFYRAPELVGQSELGTPIEIRGAISDPSERGRADEKLSNRMKVLAKVIYGLSRYQSRRYDEALTAFQEAATIKGWGDEGDTDEGRHVLDLFIGSAAIVIGTGKLAPDKLALAQQALTQAITLDDQYARAYVALGYTYFLQSLPPITATGDAAKLTHVNFELLDKAMDLLQHASRAKDQSPLADIQAKVDFYLGQCYFVRTQAGRDTTYDESYNRFQAVVVAYGDNANPRIKELAAESHARLALIYNATRRNAQAKRELEAAIALFSGQDSYRYDPMRVKRWTKMLQDLQSRPESTPTASQPLTPTRTASFDDARVRITGSMPLES